MRWEKSPWAGGRREKVQVIYLLFTLYKNNIFAFVFIVAIFCALFVVPGSPFPDPSTFSCWFSFISLLKKFILFQFKFSIGKWSRKKIDVKRISSLLFGNNPTFSDKNTHWLRFSSLFNQGNTEEKSIIPSLDKKVQKVPQKHNTYRIQNEEREKSMKTSKSNIWYSLLDSLGFHGGRCKLL